MKIVEIFKKELHKSYKETPRLQQNIIKINKYIQTNKYNSPVLFISLSFIKGTEIISKSVDTLIKIVSIPVIERIDNIYNSKFLYNIMNRLNKPSKEYPSFQKVKDSLINYDNLEKSVKTIEKEFIPNFLQCITSINKCKEILRDDHLQKLKTLAEAIESEISKHNPLISKIECIDYRDIECNIKDKQLTCDCEAQFVISFLKSGCLSKLRRFFNYKVILKFTKEENALQLDEVFFEKIN